MSERTLSILAGISRGINSAATNLVNIGMKKDEMRIEKEKFAQDKKIKDAQLKKLEIETSPEAIAGAREEHNAEMKAKKAAFDLSQMKIGKAEVENRKEQIKLTDELKLRSEAEISSMKEQGYTDEEAIGYLLSPERPSGVASVDGRTVTTAPGGYGEASMARERGDAQGIEDPFLKQLGMANRAESGRTKDEARQAIKDKDKKVNTATKKELDALGDAINDGAITTQAEALEALSQSETTMRMKGADIDYIKSKITELLPEQADIPEEESSMLGEIKNFISGTTTQKLSQVVDFIVQKFNKTKEEATRIIQKLQGE